MAKTFTGAEFAKALSSGGLRSPIVLVGMARPAENDPGHILFSPSGCESWVPVPVELIESAEHHGDVPCKDHSHPHVQIQLKEAAGTSPEGKILSALLKVWSRVPIGQVFGPDPIPWVVGQDPRSQPGPQVVRPVARSLTADALLDCYQGCVEECWPARGHGGFGPCVTACKRRCRYEFR